VGAAVTACLRFGALDWFSLPILTRRSLSSPKLDSLAHTRSCWRNPRRSRLLPWCLCVLVLIAIVFWSRKSDTVPRPKAPQKHPNAVVPPWPSPQPDAHRLGKTPQKQPTSVEFEEHVYRADGLLDVNPKGRHPILELMERSETQWKRKVKHQSKTLKQAVNEYKRRYKRLPPKGFDIW
jgi:hypothetical protein